jgi:arrestin-2
VYLGKRDFIDHLDHVDPIDGIVVVDDDYLKGRKLYGQVATTYRYGREEDEVMGLKFSKELVLAHEQLAPTEEKKTGLTPIQVMSTFSFKYDLQHIPFILMQSETI